MAEPRPETVHPIVRFIREHNADIPPAEMHRRGIHVGRLFTEKGKEYARVNVPHSVSMAFQALVKTHGFKEARHSPDNADKLHGNRTATGLRHHTTLYFKDPELLQLFKRVNEKP